MTFSNTDMHSYTLICMDWFRPSQPLNLPAHQHNDSVTVEHAQHLLRGIDLGYERALMKEIRLKRPLYYLINSVDLINDQLRITIHCKRINLHLQSYTSFLFSSLA